MATSGGEPSLVPFCRMVVRKVTQPYGGAEGRIDVGGKSVASKG